MIARRAFFTDSRFTIHDSLFTIHYSRFTEHCSLTSLLYQRPPVAISCFLRFYLPLYFTGDLRGPYLSLHDERYGRKACQRAPKPPFGFWLFIRGFGGETCGLFYVCARVQLTRFRPVRGVLRTASTDSCVLHHVQQVHNVYRITGVFANSAVG